MIDIDKLEKLLAYGSPTPWTVCEGDEFWKVITGPRILFDDGSASGKCGSQCSKADRELIVALVNAAPELLAEVRSLRQQLKDALAAKETKP